MTEVRKHVVFYREHGEDNIIIPMPEKGIDIEYEAQGAGREPHYVVRESNSWNLIAEISAYGTAGWQVVTEEEEDD